MHQLKVLRTGLIYM